MPTVLIVDDSAVDRRLVGGLLIKSRGIAVEYAEDGAKAIEKISLLAPDLVVTDLVMPEMNGLQLVSAIVREYPQIPVILMTGQGSEEIAVLALKAGAASYVPKTSLHDHLVETVLHVLAISQSRRAQQQLMGRLKTGEIVFSLGNDAEMIPSVISYVQGLVSSSGLCDEGDVVRIAIALEESLRNGMFHGNLEITSAEREGDPTLHMALIEHRTSHEPWRGRRLNFRLRMTAEAGEFVIRDEGPGFDPSQLPDPTDPINLEKVSGRGLLLIRTFMDDVRFNSTGNEITMIKRKVHPPQNQGTTS